MFDAAMTMAAGFVAGVISGLLPSIGPSMAFILFLPLVSLDPTHILIYAIMIGMGSQFFGSQAVFYYRLPGEASSLPVLLEMSNLKTADDIRHAVNVTVIGSLISSLIGLLIFWMVLGLGWFSDFKIKLIAKFAIYMIMTLVVLLSPPSKIVQNCVVLAIALFFANYVEIQNNILPILPVYFFNAFFAMVIIFSTQFLWLVFDNKLTEVSDVGDTDKHKLADILKRHRWLYLSYSTIGSIFGIIPQIGATLSSYASYAIEKYRRGDVAQRVAAAETANNAAIITQWLPLLVLGVPINIMGIVLIQHFSINDLNVNSILNDTAAQPMIILMLLISAVIYAILALKTNTVFYRAAASLLFRKDTALVICAVSIFSVVWVQQLTMMSMLVHVAVFTPLSILLYRLGANQMPLILGLLLSDEILFTSQQIMQIYLQ